MNIVWWQAQQQLWPIITKPLPKPTFRRKTQAFRQDFGFPQNHVQPTISRDVEGRKF